MLVPPAAVVGTIWPNGEVLAAVDAAPVWPKPNPPVWPKVGGAPTCWPKGEAAVVGACPKTDCPVAADCGNMGAADATGFQNGAVVAVVVEEVNVVPPNIDGVLVADVADVIVAPNIDTFAPPAAPPVDCPNNDGADTAAVVVAAAWPNVNGTDVVVTAVCCAAKDRGAVDDATVTCGMLKACGAGAGEDAVVVVGA